MQIALIGYGKMGKTMERVAQEQGHQIAQIMDIQENPMSAGFSGEWLKRTDLFIDFSTAHAVPSNVENAAKAEIPIVIGTTGWYDQLESVREMVQSHRGACLYSSNFSLGVQILFHLAREAGRLFSRFSEFHPFVFEGHHLQKVDAPSGTALTVLKSLKESYQQEIPVSSLRAGFLPGTHIVGFDSPVDTLTLQHAARNRDGFARGALVAGEWIQGKTGFYNFEEVIFGEKT